MISHFFPIDYILITPQWIAPAADSLLEVGVPICALIALLLRNPPKGKVSSVYAPSLPGSQLIAIRFNCIWWLALFVLPAIVFYLILNDVLPFVSGIKDVLPFVTGNPVKVPHILKCLHCMDKESVLKDCTRLGFRIQAIMAMLVGIMPMLICGVCFGIAHIFHTVWLHFRPIGFLHFLRNPFAGFNEHGWAITKSRVRVLLAFAILSFLLYAFSLGLCYGPVIVNDARREVDVVAQTTAYTATHYSGKLLFVLSQETLLLNDKKLISIPNQKIISLETLPTHTRKSIRR
jgi:hypothetical protein